jgi:hypothetical protein
MDIFADRRSRETASGFASVARGFGATLTHPWRATRLFMHLWYGILLVVYRVFHLR